jgi:hypothetical protein
VSARHARTLAAALRRVDAAEAQVSSGATAWCYTCRGLQSFRPPLPALQVRVLPLSVAGQRVGAQRVTLREGACAACGAAISRVGGGREADA